MTQMFWMFRDLNGTSEPSLRIDCGSAFYSILREVDMRTFIVANNILFSYLIEYLLKQSKQKVMLFFEIIII